MQLKDSLNSLKEIHSEVRLKYKQCQLTEKAKVNFQGVELMF